jgi:hypothetical protein
MGCEVLTALTLCNTGMQLTVAVELPYEVLLTCAELHIDALTPPPLPSTETCLMCGADLWVKVWFTYVKPT